MERNLLIVDDDSYVVAALQRVFLPCSYNIFVATHGIAGLAILGRENIGVVISDQRMPGMLGSEFMARAKAIRPSTIFFAISGHEESKPLEQALREGTIAEFIVKPWNDQALREKIEDAFIRRERAFR